MVDVLSHLLEIDANNGLVKGFTTSVEMVLVYHLQFVDRILSFLEPNLDTSINILSISGVFEIISVLKINLAKSG